MLVHSVTFRKKPLGIEIADTPGDRSVWREGIPKFVSDYGEVGCSFRGGEKSGELGEGFGSVEIVGIDGRERGCDDVAGGMDGLAGAPGLRAALRRCEARREVIDVLKGVGNIDSGLEFPAKSLPEIRFENPSV